MSVTKKFLLGMGGAAIMATGLAGSANAHVVAAAGACDDYARQYAAVNAPRFGTGGWNTAYRFAYNECVAGGPSFVASSALAAPAHVAGTALGAGASIAGSALHAGATLAGTALSIPGAILGGTAAALAPPATTAPPAPTVAETPEPEVVKNYRGTYETPPAAAAEPETAIAPPATTTAAALAPDVAPEPFTPEWYAFCEAKYNSFNRETGMYLAYSGTYRMCN